MRRSSQLHTQTSEPLIVVEESGVQEYEDPVDNNPSPTSEEESPTMNPYLLSPWRDARETRKHSLPTPQCSGITASQVRRLSERETGPSPRQVEFLATLTTAPAPVPGGRRHSVVTISKVPPAFFGRNRRESVAVFPSGGPGRVLPGRRDSVTGPPSTEPRGSVHNLQLDIMDDIVQARKVRMKLWNTSSEKVCEVQPLDEAGGVQRYTNSSGRRYSDFVGTTLAPIPSSSSKRRASELPPPSIIQCPTTTASKQRNSGIICTNTDLISILSSLTSSATEINQCETKIDISKPITMDQKRSRLKNNRSSSFDISILHDQIAQARQNDDKETLANWFVKRHQPMSSKNAKDEKRAPRVTFVGDIPDKKKSKDDGNKVMWDERSGSLVDAELLGNAIEVFLRRSGSETPEVKPPAQPTVSSNKGAIPKTTLNKNQSAKPKSGWFSGKNDEEASSEACDSSLCSTLKDLFVK